MNSVNPNYEIKPDSSLEKLLDISDQLKNDIDVMRPIEGDLWKTIEEKLLVEWTYNSNAIEGSTLSFGETLFLLKNGPRLKVNRLRTSSMQKIMRKLLIFFMMLLIKEEESPHP